jgi:hypothetical protein
MKVQKRIRYLVLAAILAATAVVWLACEVERTIDQVGPSEPSHLRLAQILNELAASRTPKDAEKAIIHLLEKTGIDLPVKGSNYNDYYLPDNFVAELAQAHLRYLNGEDTKNWAEAFDLEKIVSEGRWTAPHEFDEVVARLQQQAQAALAEPESPNHAVVLAMLVNGTTLPQSIAAPAPTDLISPVQEFLFEAWTEFELGDLQTLQKPKGYTHFEFTFVDCDAKGKATTRKEKVKIGWTASAAKACMEKARKDYEKAVKACLDQDKKCRKKSSAVFCCSELQQCLIAAHQHVLSDIDECLEGHDQGGKR